MNIKYDSKMDALYINLSKGRYNKTKKVTDTIMVDLAADGKVIGIEILDASKNIQQFNPTKFKLPSQQ